MPLSLLGDIFTRLLEHTGSLDATVRLWQGLALVCKSWLLALRESTPLCLELTKPEHLSATARSWLSRVPLEVCGPHLPVHAAASFCCLRFAAACCAHTLQLLVALLCPPNQAFTGVPGLYRYRTLTRTLSPAQVLVLARTMALPPGADCQLLAGEAFQARSAPLLRSLMHASPEALPLLHSFSRLKQVRAWRAEKCWMWQGLLKLVGCQQAGPAALMAVAGWTHWQQGFSRGLLHCMLNHSCCRNSNRHKGAAGAAQPSTRAPALGLHYNMPRAAPARSCAGGAVLCGEQPASAAHRSGGFPSAAQAELPHCGWCGVAAAHLCCVTAPPLCCVFPACLPATQALLAVSGCCLLPLPWAGYWGALDTAELPTRLKHLALR